MPNSILSTGTVLALLGLASMATAQHNVKTALEVAECYQGVRFDTVHGTVTVLLPTDLAVGTTVSGTVLVNPKGDNAMAKAASKKALAAMTLMVLGKTMQGSPSQFSLTVPNSPTVSMPDAGAGATQKLATVPRADLFAGAGDRMPSLAQVGAPIPVTGKFDGAAENTSVSFGKEGGLILTESPNSLTVMPTHAGAGPCDVAIREGSQTQTLHTNLVAVSLKLPKTTIVSGERLTLGCEVTGLGGLPSAAYPVKVQLHNLSPGTISMSGGNDQTKLIAAGEATSNGAVNWTVPLSGLVAGTFTIQAALELPGFPWPGLARPDADWPIPMDGTETLGELDRYTVRRLMDTLRDLRARKWYDLMHGGDHQEFLSKCLRKIKAALGQKGVEVPDEPIDE